MMRQLVVMGVMVAAAIVTPRGGGAGRLRGGCRRATGPSPTSMPMAGAAVGYGGGYGYGTAMEAGPITSYDYWAAFPGPARRYVPYGGADIFPYHGDPYGHAYASWSWSALSGWNNDRLAHYYYPPLR